MGQTKNEKPANRREPPALTVEARENQMISLADEEAEKRIRSGKASDSLLLHYLKLGTTKNELEKAKLEAEKALAEAKVESIRQAEKSEELYANAIKAMTVYTGQGEEEDYDD
jgi:hypothetical protein